MSVAEEQLGFQITRKAAPGPVIRSLHDLVGSYMRGSLIVPPHQRTPSWPQHRKRDYIRRIKGEIAGDDPPGGFETYQLDNDISNIMYLNDGNNRLNTLQEYLLRPEIYGDTQETAETNLRALYVSVRHHNYPSHSIGHIDFILVNIGSVGSAYEQGHGILIYARDESMATRNEEILNQLHGGVAEIASRVVSAKTPRAQEQKHKRHNYGLLYRYMSKDTRRRSYYVGRSRIRYEDIEHKNVIEWKLRDLIDGRTQADLEHEVNTFLRAVDKFTADIQTVYKKLFPSTTLKIRHACYRWLLDVAFWKRNEHISVENWEEFLAKILAHTRGNSQIKNPADPERSYVNMSLGDLSRLPVICRHIGFDWALFDSSARPKRKRRDPRVPAGFDVSHVDPLGTGDDNSTVIEPASANRARGRKSIREYDPFGVLVDNEGAIC